MGMIILLKAEQIYGFKCSFKVDSITIFF